MNALDSGHPNTAEVHARQAGGAIYARLNDPWGKVESLVAPRTGGALSAETTTRPAKQLIRCEAIALAEAEPKQHRHLTLAWLAAAEERWADVVRELDAARRTFKDATQSGDHSPQLLRHFDAMGWPEPANARVKQWLSSITRR